MNMSQAVDIVHHNRNLVRPAVPGGPCEALHALLKGRSGRLSFLITSTNPTWLSVAEGLE
jgi:hypothetical protein